MFWKSITCQTCDLQVFSPISRIAFSQLVLAFCLFLVQYNPTCIFFVVFTWSFGVIPKKSVPRAVS